MTAGYDPQERAAAATIGLDHPAWLVMWGPYTRRFWGFPLFRAWPGTLVCDAGLAGLLEAMRQAEMAAGYRRPGPAGHAGTR